MTRGARSPRGRLRETSGSSRPPVCGPAGQVAVRGRTGHVAPRAVPALYAYWTKMGRRARYLAVQAKSRSVAGQAMSRSVAGLAKSRSVAGLAMSRLARSPRSTPTGRKWVVAPGTWRYRPSRALVSSNNMKVVAPTGLHKRPGPPPASPVSPPAPPGAGAFAPQKRAWQKHAHALRDGPDSPANAAPHRPLFSNGPSRLKVYIIHILRNSPRPANPSPRPIPAPPLPVGFRPLFSPFRSTSGIVPALFLPVHDICSNMNKL